MTATSAGLSVIGFANRELGVLVLVFGWGLTSVLPVAVLMAMLVLLMVGWAGAQWPPERRDHTDGAYAFELGAIHGAAVPLRRSATAVPICLFQL